MFLQLARGGQVWFGSNYVSLAAEWIGSNYHWSFGYSRFTNFYMRGSFGYFRFTNHYTRGR